MSLFDISTCKCTLFLKCDCPKEKKIPKKEAGFFKDQRTTRKTAIEDLDSKSKKINFNSMKRKCRIQSYIEKKV